MEGIQKFISGVSKDMKDMKFGKSGSSENSSYLGGGEGRAVGVAAALSAPDSRVLINRYPRNSVSLWTCSKLCALFFVAGVVAGYTLKQRVRRWASRLLKRLRDD